MLNEEDYSSDTSDEDFIPGTISDDEVFSECEEIYNDDEIPTNKRKQKEGKKSSKRKKKTKTNPLLASVQEVEENDETEEKVEVNEQEERKKVDSLWEDFLADVDEKPAEEIKPKSKNSWAALLDPKKKKSNSNQSTSTTATSSKPYVKSTAEENKASTPSVITITKVFEFAGEEVRVEEKVSSDSIEAKHAEVNENKNYVNKKIGMNKPVGLSSVVGLLNNKTKKLSTLEKTKLDWTSFKSSEGLEEELQTHLKSKDGYLEKKEFLERADLRQFEIERNMRMSRKSNR